MVDSRTLWLLLPSRVREFPADLGVVLAIVTGACLSVLLPGVRETPIRLLFGLPFVLLTPGYSLVAALFPGRAGTGPVDEGDSKLFPTGTDDELSRYGRLVLSVGMSVAIVPLLGLALNFTPLGVNLLPVVFSIAAFTVVASIWAAIRRAQLPADRRYRVRLDWWPPAPRDAVFETETRMDAVLNVVLALALVVALASSVYAVAAPDPGQSYSEMALLTQDDEEFVANGYPTEFAAGEGQSLYVSLANHENERTDYTVVVRVQRLSDETRQVTDQERLHQFRPTLDSGETWRHEHTIAPEMVGTRLRLQYLLYRGTPPQNPQLANSYRSAQLWINVTDSETG